MIPINILDSLSCRFLIDLDEHDKSAPERIFFILEEAHWFMTDHYNVPGTTLLEFSRAILAHIGMQMNVSEALAQFVRYRQSVKVYGAIIVSPDMTHLLVVKEHKKPKSFSFPKGKKCMNEDGIECAVREVYEEIGYDIRDKVCNMPITIFDKITLYFVFNVKREHPFRTQTNKEIDEIKWLSIKRLMRGEYGRGYSIITTAYKRAMYLFETMIKCRFKFNAERICRRIDKALKNREK
jgi:mRNA-decapping enzyme subunit 2